MSHLQRPPPIPADMGKAMRHTGIRLQETLMWRSIPARRSNASVHRDIVTIIPGLCRMCGHRPYMEHLFSTLNRGAVVFLLQSAENRSYASCLRTIQLVADGLGSHVVVGRQWFSARLNDMPCNRTYAHKDSRGTFPRVQMQAGAAMKPRMTLSHHSLACGRRHSPSAARTNGPFTSSRTASTS